MADKKNLLAIAMTTAPRSKPTLARALLSLRHAGFSERVRLFAEPGSFDEVPCPTDSRLSVRVNSARLGCFGNWRRSLKHLVRHGDARWILIVQDDAVWQPGSADVLRDELRVRQGRRVGFLSSYVTQKDAPAGSADGWHECRSGWDFWGALALCLPCATAEELLLHPRFTKYRSSQQVDALVARSMLDLGRPSFVHVPSLVDHVGETSTIGHDHRLERTRGYRFDEK